MPYNRTLFDLERSVFTGISNYISYFKLSLSQYHARAWCYIFSPLVNMPLLNIIQLIQKENCLLPETNEIAGLVRITPAHVHKSCKTSIVVGVEMCSLYSLWVSFPLGLDFVYPSTTFIGLITDFRFLFP